MYGTAFDLRAKDDRIDGPTRPIPDTKPTGGAVTEFLHKVNLLARSKFSPVGKLRSHVRSEYERLSNGTTELATLTEKLKKALMEAESELSKSPKLQTVQDR